MALRKKTKVKGDDDNAKSGPGGAKPILMILLVLNVIAGGYYAYLRVSGRKDHEGSLLRAERTLPALRDKATRLNNVARRIRGENVTEVSKPAATMMSIVSKFNIKEKVTIDKERESRWKKSNYKEVEVNVRFRDKEGYDWKDLIRLMTAIEKANPKIHVKEVDFGKRDSGKGETLWRPRHVKVRLLRPRDDDS